MSTLREMRETVEREIKLVPREGFVLPELGGERLPTRTFVSTYHDTGDLRLARNGVTFRYRVEDGTGLWQLKLPQGAARIELPGAPAHPPAEMLALLPAFLRGVELVPVVRLRTRREVVRAEGTAIVDDTVSVIEGRRVARRFRELELELLDGDESVLRRLEQELRRAGAEAAGSQKPKLYRALDLAEPAKRHRIPAGTPSVEALGMAFEEQYRRLLDHDPGTRRGGDPEDLHQLRVATRKLRAFLRATRPLVDRDWAESLRAELGWLGSALGPARDLDVMLERLRTEVGLLDEDANAAQGLLDELETERTRAYAHVVEVLDDERYARLLDRLEAAAAPPLSGARTSLAEIWAGELKRTRRVFAALGADPEDAALHKARIAVKRARYAGELAAHELGRPGAVFVARAKELQDVLGDHQDAVVAEERIRAWADAAADESRVAAGRLVQLERARRAAGRAAWPEAWARLDRAARKAAS